ncbi:heterokaryon incompatibility protein-domain-containing protein [Halenospora varia]|nr:heterokaryon incompatibility protein-domain-containing protein [Halenospora varia]
MFSIHGLCGLCRGVGRKRPSPESRNEALDSPALETRQDDLDDGEDEELQHLERYQYNPLSANDKIRVFHFQDTKSRLECTIKEIKLSDGGYTALSYEWGSQETPFRMFVRDRDGRALGYIPLTTNLHNALTDLQDTPGLEGKHYWIDQITINQCDNLEKGHQVKLMKDVYGNAFQVITYLGTHAKNMEEEAQALDLLLRIDTHFCPNYKYLDFKSMYEKYFYDLGKLPVQKPPDDTFGNDPAWPALLRIVFGAWLGRLWMVQENILCPNTVMLRGHKQLEWLSIAAIPILFHLQLLPVELLDREVNNLGLRFSPLDNLSPLALTWDARHAQIHRNKARYENFRPLADNLAFYDLLDCENPRDRIFAVLGVSADADVLGIEPDYKIPVHELYTQVSKRILIHGHNLYFLGIVGKQEVGSHPLLLTWAFAGTPQCMVTISSFRPHPYERSDIEFEDNDRTMVIKGHIARKLRFVSEPVNWYKLAKDEKDWIMFYSQIVTLCCLVMKSATNPENSVKALLSALVADYHWALTVSETTFYTWCFCRYLATCLHTWTLGSIERQEPVCDEIRSMISLLHKLFQNDDTIIQVDPWSPITDEEYKVGREMLGRTRIEGRSIAITENEEFCNVTGRAQQDDVIALLAGGELAYVLRAVGDKYQYIGDAYVHEFVDGDAYKDVSPEEVDVEIRII